MSDAGALETRLDAIEEWQRDAQRVLLEVSHRQDDVQELSTATDRLAGSVESVDSVLRDVRDTRIIANEAKQLSEDVRDSTLPKETIEAGHHRVLRLAIILAVGAVFISLAAAGAVWHRARVDAHNSAVARYTGCQNRNAQVAQNSAYSRQVFAILSRDDPSLARDLSHLRVRQGAPIQCVKP